MSDEPRTTVEATINLDFLSQGERTDLPAADLEEQPVKYYLERGYLKVVDEVPAVAVETRKTSRSKSAE